MASVNWTQEGLSSLARLDAWRRSQGWQPIARELLAAIESYFRRWDPGQPPRFVPGRQVQLAQELTDLRMVTVTVRSKPFRVYFRYQDAQHIFEILRIVHPRAH